MVTMQIIVMKCKVNICDQDLGSFCQERGPGGKKKNGGEEGATEPPDGWDVEALVEVNGWIGGGGWVGWAPLAILDAGAWLWALRSLLGRLWWHWVFLLEGAGACSYY